MSGNPLAQFSGTPMSRDDIRGLLTSQGYGVLALCRDGEPYSIPVSFGYDDERVYFPFLVDSDDATKTRFIADGAVARLLVTDIRGRFDWRSVAITGPVRSVDPDDDEEWTRFADALEDNAWFMRSFARADSVSSVQGWELEVEELRGLERTEEVYD
jgi:hypothetical protein